MPGRSARGLAAVLAASAATAALSAATLPREGAALSKIEARLLAGPAGEPADVLVELAEQPDLSAAYGLPGKHERGRYVFERLTETARRSQSALAAWLAERGIEHQTFWIANMIRVRAPRAVLGEIARRAEVSRIEANPRVRARLPLPSEHAAARRRAMEALAAAATPWNLTQVGAPDVWAAGYTGQGIVVGGADTGYEWAHPALKPRYRGWNGTTASHAYNWHDAIHNARQSNACGSDSPAPCDDDGHGTGTMGIAVGDDGAGNRIGMAPGARWIGCRNMDDGDGTPARYTECFQWFLAPTDQNDANPSPDLAPDVITNSWDCPPVEGCTTPDILRTVIENVRAAGIVVVVSAGNDGPDCDTIGVPGIYESVITVGSTNDHDLLTNYSSRGPGEGTGVKPDVSAPGEGIPTSHRGGIFNTLSGTSAAAPHVAGLVALILSAAPGLSGDPASIEAIVRGTAQPHTSSETCGGLAAGVTPNNEAGYGRIDAAAAIDNVLCPPSAPVVTAPASVPPTETGLTASVAARPAHDYAWTIQGGTITSGNTASLVSFSSGAAGTTMSLSVVDSFETCQSPATVARVQVDFLDVPPAHLFHQPVVQAALGGITTGCGGGNYCPDDAVTRAQMAVFILRAVHGSSYKPPAASGTMFGDVPLGTFLGDWIERFAVEGYTTGCGGGNYCPDEPLNRAAAAVFLLRGKHGTAYTPPAASGTVFADVPLGTFLGRWIEELAVEVITGGCGGGNFCPEESLTRGEMAAFLKRTFSLS